MNEMREWTDGELTTLLADAMAAHEDEASADRARVIAQDAQPVRQHWPAVAAASAAVILICVGAVYVVARSSEPASAPATSDGGPTTSDGIPPLGSTKENYQRAVAASEAAVESAPMPEDAVRLDGEPSAWPESSTSIGPSDETLTRTAWWSAPLTDEQVAAFLTDHAPPGMRRPDGEDVVVDGDSDHVGYTDYTVVTAADPAAYTGPTVLVQFKQVGDHTLLRVDTFLGARYAVPDELRVTGRVASVEIERVGPGDLNRMGDGGPLPTVRLTSADDAVQIDRLVDAFNGLYGSLTTGLVISCPMNPDAPSYSVTFVSTASDGTVHTTVAKVAPFCLGQLSASVDGKPMQITLDPAGWPEVVDEVADGAKGSEAG